MDLEQYFKGIGYSVDWDFRGARRWYEIRADGGSVQVDVGATVDALLEDLPLLLDGKPGTSSVNYEVRGARLDVEELLRRMQEASASKVDTRMKMWIQKVFDVCTDNDVRRRLHALAKGDMREFEALDDASRNQRKERAEPGDKISGVGYCHDAPGGVVYHVDREGRAYCVTIRGVDGLLAQECYKVFGKVDFVPGMLEAHRNIVIEEMADWLRSGAAGWVNKDSADEAANAMLKLMKKTMEDR